MADNVIHGTGKPRFILPTDVFLGTGYTVSSATSTQIVISGTPDLETINNSAGGLVGMQVWSQNSDSEDTWGKITAYNDTTDTLTIVSTWSNGTPNNGKLVYIKGRLVDLPYCQRLTERFVPDFIVKKMFDGSIRRIKRGFYYSATLDYARYFHKDEMQILKYLYEKTMNGCGFYPRLDNTAVLYTVDIDPESEISFYQLKNHQGHGGIVINIVGITRVANIPLSDPTQTLTDTITDDAGEYITDDRGEYITED